MHTPDFIFGLLKESLILSSAERDEISRSIRFFRSLSPATSTGNPTQLYAYEKALMFGVLEDLRKDLPLRKENDETPDIRIRVWHGTLFSHLQPFVLR